MYQEIKWTHLFNVMRQNNQFAVINQKYIMSFCEWLWARICTPISSDDSLKFRDRICHSFLFFFCSALWRCFGEIGSSVPFFCISDRFSYCVTVFFTQKAHFWPRAVLTLMCRVHFSHTPLNDERRIARIPFFLHACGFHLFCLNMLGRQGDQDLHPEVQLDVGCRFESHSSVGYWLHTVLH